MNGNKFPYGIGVEYDGREIKDADLEIVEIPAHTFAVFTCKGKISLYTAIKNELLFTVA
ncbi:MAG: effector binding domain-containing protein [Treponema sp.]|nr:effector binding domain-containing protein [Treponema sp.]